jgi:hypothetical protein
MRRRIKKFAAKLAYRRGSTGADLEDVNSKAPIATSEEME